MRWYYASKILILELIYTDMLVLIRCNKQQMADVTIIEISDYVSGIFGIRSNIKVVYLLMNMLHTKVHFL